MVVVGDGEPGTVRRAKWGLLAFVIAWPVTLASVIAWLAGHVGPVLVVIAGSTATIALAEATRYGSTVIARGSWSQPANAVDVSRRSRAISLAGLLVFALVPILGALGAVDIESKTAQVESTTRSYKYRIEYGPLQTWIRRSILVTSASTTVITVLALLA